MCAYTPEAAHSHGPITVKSKQKERKVMYTALGFPRRSPIQVLT